MEGIAYLPSTMPMFNQLSFSLVNLIFYVIIKEDYPRVSAAVAGDRKFDVYMGIDVFGRNTYGGGQWNVCNLSVKLLISLFW
jgi:hypothetical protein